MRRKRVIANWKMNGHSAMVDQLLTPLPAEVKGLNSLVIVCPPAVYLQQANIALADSGIRLGAQNLSEHEKGAYTGEISAMMLKDRGCSYVLVGHSERRTFYGETDSTVSRKMAAALREQLTPVLCIGESEQQREQGETEQVVTGQLNAVVAETGIEAFAKAVIAYEPVWAIGTGKTATPEQAQAVHEHIRQHIAALNEEIAAELPLLYGGSVNAANAAELFAMPDIDGGLIGGASLDLQAFTAICNAAG